MKDNTNRTKGQLINELEGLRNKLRVKEDEIKRLVALHKDNLNNTEKQLFEHSRLLNEDKEISFQRLFDISDIQKLQDQFALATGVASIITEIDGTPITKPSNFCRLCIDIIRNTEIGLINCYKSDAELGKPNSDGPSVKPCLSGGLWDAGASIIVDGRHIANWLIGQVRDETQSDEMMRSYAQEIGADEEAVSDAFKEVKAMSKEQFEAISQMLYTLASQISEMAFQNLKRSQIITRQQRVEESLLKSESRLLNLFNSMTDIVFEMDYNGTYLNIAPTSPKLMYNPPEETTGKTLHEVFPKKQADMFLYFIQKCIDENEPDKIVYSFDFENRTVWFEGRANPIGDRKVLYIASDITDRKLVEEKLKTERDLFSKGPVFIIEWDSSENWPVKYVSENIFDILGYKSEQIMNPNFRYADLMHPEDVLRVNNEIDDYLKDNIDSYEQSYRLKHKNGNYLWFYDFTKLIKDSKNQVIQYRGYLFDQTNLKTALEKAEESDRLKTAFLTNMSHEIRTPMNGILGFTSLLKNHELSGEKQNEYIGIIEKSGQRMLSTINDIIDISRIEAGLVEISKTEVSVNMVLEELFNFFVREAKEKGIDLVLVKDDSKLDYLISTDKVKFEGILINLIKNAIKFTPKGQITFGYLINSENDRKTIEFYVVDTGIGIPDDRVDAIFNRFEKADIEDTRVFEGSGLGLSICKSYAKMLNGNITVSSIEGSGTTFKLILPLFDSTLFDSQVKNKVSAIQRTSLSDLTVIVAEDDEVNKHFLEIILNGEFKKIYYTITGRETIDLCRKNSEIDLILMDIKMPDIGGFNATKEIRKFNQDVIIIAQTAYVNSDIKEKAIDAGCNDFISKPTTKEDLLEKIKKQF